MEELVHVEQSQDSSGTVLQDLATNETSLLRLFTTLLAPRTSPHIILIIAVSIVLFILAGTELGNDVAALGFVSIAAGYAVTGVFSSNQRVRKWTHLTSESNDDLVVSSSVLGRIISPFRICIFPLTMATIVAVFIVLVLPSEDGLLPAYVPFILGSMFIIWAVAQGRSFSTWASSMAAKQLPKRERIDAKIVPHVLFQLSAVTAFSILGVLLFAFLQIQTLEGESNNVGMSSLLENAMFIGIVIALYGLTVAWTFEFRKMALRDRSLNKFTSRWTLFAHLFATWHLLTIWRYAFMQHSTMELLIEELALMILTVFMAIWSITSKSVGKQLKLLSTENALPWGLAFGYAYAGSVAMLANEFNSITNVMVIGHLIVVLTVTWMQKSVLKRVFESHNLSVEIERLSHPAESSAEVPSIEFEQVRKNDSTGLEVAEETEVENIDWDSETPDAIDEKIEWDDVIEVED